MLEGRVKRFVMMLADDALPPGTLVAAGDRGVEQTFGRTRAVLDALTEARNHGLRFTDLVRITGFSKATVHRLLAGLAQHDFIEAGSDGRYFLGYRLASWGAAARDRHSMVERATPVLRALAERSGDTAYLSIRIGPMAFCVARQEGTFPIRALPLTPGDWNALGVGSGSLALLAFLPTAAEIDRVLADPENIRARGRRNVSEQTIRHLARSARESGYVLADGLTPGMTGLALPVLSRAGRIIAAVSIATTSERLRQPRLGEVLVLLRDATREMGHALGEVPDY
jgi:DNA-binding IclR family transcriptional regulator